MGHSCWHVITSIVRWLPIRHTGAKLCSKLTPGLCENPFTTKRVLKLGTVSLLLLEDGPITDGFLTLRYADDGHEVEASVLVEAAHIFAGYRLQRGCLKRTFRLPVRVGGFDVLPFLPREVPFSFGRPVAQAKARDMHGVFFVMSEIRLGVHGMTQSPY